MSTTISNEINKLMKNRFKMGPKWNVLKHIFSVLIKYIDIQYMVNDMPFINLKKKNRNSMTILLWIETKNIWLEENMPNME